MVGFRLKEFEYRANSKVIEDAGSLGPRGSECKERKPRFDN